MFSSTEVSVQSVREHLRQMNLVFEETSLLTTVQLYEYLLNLDCRYEKENINNFANAVHLLHPCIYYGDSKRTATTVEKFAAVDHLKCPFCSVQFLMPSAYQIHVLSKAIICQNCNVTVTPENLYVAAFLRNHAIGFYGDNLYLGETLTISDGQFTWRSLTSNIANLIKSYGPTLSNDSYSQRQKCSDMRNRYKSIVRNAQRTLNLSSVSLDLVKGMYRQLDFVNKICINFNYWNEDATIVTAIARYFKFMDLMRIKRNKILVPTMDIDLVWHTHQTMASDYYTCCVTSFRTLINHDDTIPGNHLQKGYTRTFIYWSRAYHEPYSRHPPDHSAWLKDHESFYYNGIYREIQWMLYSSTNRPIQGVPTAVAVEVVEDSPGVVKPKCVIATPVYDSSYRPDNNLTTNIVPVLTATHSMQTNNANRKDTTGGCGGGCGGGCAGLRGCAGVGGGCGGGCGGGGGDGCGGCGDG